jgi:hypothetical protein
MRYVYQGKQGAVGIGQPPLPEKNVGFKKIEEEVEELDQVYKLPTMEENRITQQALAQSLITEKEEAAQQ